MAWRTWASIPRAWWSIPRSKTDPYAKGQMVDPTGPDGTEPVGPSALGLGPFPRVPLGKGPPPRRATG